MHVHAHVACIFPVWGMRVRYRWSLAIPQGRQEAYSSLQFQSSNNCMRRICLNTLCCSWTVDAIMKCFREVRPHLHSSYQTLNFSTPACSQNLSDELRLLISDFLTACTNSTLVSVHCVNSCLSQIDRLLRREVTTDQTIAAENNL